MKISGTVVFERKKDEGSEQFLNEQFLEFYINGVVHRVAYNDFRDNLSEELVEEVPAAQIGIGVPIGQVSSSVPGSISLKKALDFLLNNVHELGEIITDDAELIIESDAFVFLRLPWETRIDRKKTIVLRQIANGSSSKRQELAASNRANFLIIRSHAHKNGATDIGDLRDRMKEEVHCIVDELMENSHSQLRVGGVEIIKHGTKEEISRVEFNSLHYVHMIMHGEESGNLCLEKTNLPDQIDTLSRDEFLSLLERAGVNGVLLFFLSFCYSGGGEISESNLSFELVKRGIAEYAVGYDGGVGNDSAMDFAKDFYPYLASGKGIKDSFAEAYRKRVGAGYMPLLYGRFLETEELHI